MRLPAQLAQFGPKPRGVTGYHSQSHVSHSECIDHRLCAHKQAQLAALPDGRRYEAQWG